MKRLEQQLSTTSIHETQSSNSVRNHSDPPSGDDLLISIFSRLPLKSIARFRCVSKFLASILSRHDFTELFLTKSLTRPRLLFTVKATNGKLLFYSSPQPHNPDNNSCLVPTPYHTSSFPEYLPSDICSTVCGLVLLQGWKRKVRVICNPATGEFLTLPKVKVKSNPTEIAQTKTYLGYDPIGKQFKVLCVTFSRDERPKTHQVLTLESGKRVWRTVEHKFYFEDNFKMSGDVCIDGVLYFGAAVGRSSMIVCFDVGSEKFSFINTNEDMRIQYPCLAGSLTLFNYKGKLGIRQDSDNMFCENELVLWVLEDAGNHKWSKHSYVLSPLGSDLVQYNRFIGMTSTGEVVFSELSQLHEPSDLFYLSFYNLQSGTFKRVYFQGLEEFKQQFTTPHTFLDYVENIKFM
uniref:F-box domain-containing protein n=1 Tax=Brassica oleracea var. oleracea TaxID=109376 RepID=A0A0D3BKX8_BRAOL